MLSYLPFCLPASSCDLPRAEQTVSNYPIFVSRLLWLGPFKQSSNYAIAN